MQTSFSMDAGAFGCRLAPSDAYRFAKGHEIASSTGQRVRLSRPLDFMVVTDHSDGFGFFPMLIAGDPKIVSDPQGRRWHEMIASGKGGDAALEIVISLGKGTISKAIFPVPGTTAFRGAWQETIKAADEANEPGRFTAFIGFEWTSTTGGNNLHRNVIFRESGERAGRVEPFVTTKPYGSDDPRDLWKWMAATEEKTGSELLTLAHNGNGSNGRMFPIIESFTGKPVDREYAELRARWEPLYEATQIKGDGETRPLLSPNDEFANFERWDKGNVDLTELKKPEMLEFEYVRSGLKNGLKLEAELGINPYKFGLVGSTDSHTALTAVEENNFFGKHSGAEPSSHRATHAFLKSTDGSKVVMGWEMTAAGYAAVWATENTREAIFDALKRRETYATTGPRMLVRLFAGWDFEPKDAEDRMLAKTGCTKGVPMGGDLQDAPAGRSPTFLIGALKDPVGANLDRIQVIKGWLDRDGRTQERIYDVAVSDGRKVDGEGRCRTPVGDTVDVKNATWTNTIGAGELISVWKDPDFDPSLRAFYYVRVLEIPTPRWTAYDAKYFGLELPKEVPMTTVERAYTSPIWYTPAASGGR